jgi:hypothetical protein
VSTQDWFVAPDSFDNPTLWERNHERPDYPIALLVRVPSNAALFDGIVELLATAARAAEDREIRRGMRDDAESRARDMEIERNMLRTCLAETLAMLEELDAAWGGTGEVCS